MFGRRRFGKLKYPKRHSKQTFVPSVNASIIFRRISRISQQSSPPPVSVGMVVNVDECEGASEVELNVEVGNEVADSFKV